MTHRVSFLNKGWKGPLAVRQLTFILVFSSLITLISAGTQIFIEYRADLDEVRLQLDQIGHGYLESLTSSLWKLDDGQILVQLKDALSHRDIEYLEIREDSEIIFATGHLPDSDSVITLEFDMLFIDSGVEKNIGTLKAVASLAGTYDRMFKRILIIVITQAIKTFLVSFFILFIIYRFVIRHLIDLGRYSKQLDIRTAENDMFVLRRSSRFSSGDDELDDLVTAVNKMQSRALQDIRDIKEKEERYRQTIESSIDGFWVMDAKGYLLEVNQAYCDMTGFDREQLLTMSITELQDQTGSQIIKWLKKISEVGHDRFETRHWCKNGDRVDLEISITYSLEQDGCFFLFLRNISPRKKQEKEKKKLEQKLRQSQKMESLGTLAGGIAHDFNNILVPILGNTEMIMDDIPENSSLRTHLNEILSGTLRARDLVKQILTFSRQGEQEIKQIQVQPILKEALKLLRSTIPSSISIKADIRKECPQVNADPTQIHQIILNLATNAYHAMEKHGGTLSIKLKEIRLDTAQTPVKVQVPGTYAWLTVSDTGTGMDKKTLGKIFDPFYTTKQLQKGTGLGLSMVHGIVTGYGGSIQVYSEPGRGSRFDVYLPAAGDRPNDTDTGQILTSLPLGEEHILLVDDEPAVLSVAERLLSRLGYKVTPAVSGTEALELFKINPYSFDLVMTDYSMPEMTGDLLGKAVVNIRADIPVLICTGFSNHAALKDGDPAICGIIHKPLVMTDLAVKIRKILDTLS